MTANSEKVQSALQLVISFGSESDENIALPALILSFDILLPQINLEAERIIGCVGAQDSYMEFKK